MSVYSYTHLFLSQSYHHTEELKASRQKTLDYYRQTYNRIHNDGEGDCGTRTVSQYLNGNEDAHLEVRAGAVNVVSRYSHLFVGYVEGGTRDDLNRWMKKMSKRGKWTDELALVALAMYSNRIIVIVDDSLEYPVPIEYGAGMPNVNMKLDPIVIYRSGRSHFELLEAKVERLEPEESEESEVESESEDEEFYDAEEDEEPEVEGDDDEEPEAEEEEEESKSDASLSESSGSPSLSPKSQDKSSAASEEQDDDTLPDIDEEDLTDDDEDDDEDDVAKEPDQSPEDARALAMEVLKRVANHEKDKGDLEPNHKAPLSTTAKVMNGFKSAFWGDGTKEGKNFRICVNDCLFYCISQYHIFPSRT